MGALTAEKHEVHSKSVNLLSLDGGGIRGLSELLILHEIMQRIQKKSGSTILPRPCDYFDLIGGRLQMNTKDAIDRYLSLAGQIFGKKNKQTLLHNGIFKAKTLENCIQRIVQEVDLGDRMIKPGESREGGLAFVCAVPVENSESVRKFRTYEVDKIASHNCLIWEASRATTAAPMIFKGISITDDFGITEEFVDGALLCNNPSKQVMNEARLIWGNEATLNCFVSLGTGMKEVNNLSASAWYERLFPKTLIKAMCRIATDCEVVASELEERFVERPNIFFRFNLDRGAENVGLAEWEKMNTLSTHTKRYIEKISHQIDKLVSILCRPTESYDANVNHINLGELCGVHLPKVSDLPVSVQYNNACRSPTPLFTGREEVLLQLENFFRIRAVSRSERREFLLHGIGGAGKTQIALKFAELNRRRWQYIFCIDAHSRESIENCYKTIALQIDPSLSHGTGVSTSMGILERFTHDWLLIFDNADDLDSMSNLWPPGKFGNIIYTSRNPMLRRLPEDSTCLIEGMNKAEAASLLLKASSLGGIDNQVVVFDIVEELGFHALAIDQAGAYIASGRCSLHEYTTLLRTNRTELLGRKCYNTASDPNQAVYATWDLSYKAIKRTAANSDSYGATLDPKAAQFALQLLNILAFFHYQGINEDVFRLAAENPYRIRIYEPNFDTQNKLARGFSLPIEFLDLNSDGKWNNSNFRKAIQILLSYSLISRTSTINEISLHPLVRHWNSDRVTSLKDSRHLLCAGDLLSAAIERSTEGNLMDRHVFRLNILPHVSSWCHIQSFEKEPFVAHLIYEFALIFHDAELWDKAESIVTEVIKWREKILGGRHPETLRVKSHLSVILSNRGNWKEAETLQVSTLDSMHHILGDNHSLTLQSMWNLSRIYERQARHQEAEKITLQALEAIQTSGVVPDQLRMSLLVHLTMLYCKQNRWKEARTLALDNVKTSKELFGDEHIITLETIQALAGYFYTHKKPRDAERLQLEAIKMTKKLWGMDHPQTSRALSTLEGIYAEQGKWRASIELGEQVASALKESLGPSHPDTLMCLNNLAFAYKVGGRREEAIDLMKHVQQGFSKMYGEAHPVTQDATKALSAWRNPRKNIGIEMTEFWIRRNNLVARKMYSYIS